MYQLVDTATVTDKGKDKEKVDLNIVPKSMIMWMDSVLQHPLSFAKAQLELHRGTVLNHMVPLSGMPNVQVASNSGYIAVDHAVGLKNALQQPLVLGIARSSAYWSPADLIANAVQSTATAPAKAITKDMVLPLRQLGSACLRLNCRYGYIHTDNALVACCFSVAANGMGNGFNGGASSASPKLKVQIMPVPWSTEEGSGQHTLTTEMALWWLCMLSLSGHPREVVPEDQVMPIDTWASTSLNDGLSFLRRHYYSGAFERGTAPPSFGFGSAFASGPSSGFGFDNRQQQQQ
ncbi:hypothetical protein SCUCBS95973_001303 [Sporothrix curviconia]|uniref:Uncharacterized protein n=1 Tax=Sporothrix curviconia TaxID=1260050 RepID=A0ABP0AXF1_9PEZI